MFEKHIFTYYHKDKWWDIDIIAESEADARERIQQMQLAQHVGVAIGPEIPVQFGFLVWLACLVQNKIAQLRERGRG